MGDRVGGFCFKRAIWVAGWTVLPCSNQSFRTSRLSLLFFYPEAATERWTMCPHLHWREKGRGTEGLPQAHQGLSLPQREAQPPFDSQSVCYSFNFTF